MDGTLADVRSIRHHIMGGNRNFDAFHSESIDAPAHDHVVSMVHKAVEDGHDILIVTARMAKWRNHTAMWLAMHGVPSHALFMRGDDDHRKDYLVKKDILDKINQTWNVVHAVDDNPAVIQLWEDNGIPTTIIEGWFDSE